jgi:hypothetical protein
MLFDDNPQDYGVASMPVGAPVNPLDPGHGAASGIAGTATTNDDWLLGTGLHPLDFNVFTPPAPAVSPGGDAGGGIGGITGGAMAADHDRMMVIDPYATDPIYFTPPPSRPPPKLPTITPWYYIDLTPVMPPAKPT